uniref:Uncharacterized protein n=1 Tax=Zea mays TaxID=4577 RepID=C4J7Y4_MAIZE|nr:unknown [Zea mays]
MVQLVGCLDVSQIFIR